MKTPKSGVDSPACSGQDDHGSTGTGPQNPAVPAPLADSAEGLPDGGRLKHPALSWLLGEGMSPDEFFAKYFERSPFTVSRQDPDYYRGIYTPNDIEQTAFSFRVHMGTAGMMAMSSGDISESPESIVGLCRAYLQGQSLVFNKFDRVHPRVNKLCRDLQTAFPFVFAVSYLTPPGSQAAPVHNDDQDIFILQVSGKKRWTLYESPSLIFDDEMMGKEKRLDPQRLKAIKEFTLGPGDFLYMPRGVLHECHTNPDEHSLHITLTMQSSQWAWGTLFRKQVGEVCRRRDPGTPAPWPRSGGPSAPGLDAPAPSFELLMRRSLPLDATALAPGSAGWAGLDATFAAAKAAIVEAVTLESMLDNLRREIATQRSLQLQYINKLPVLRPCITTDTVIAVSPGFRVALGGILPPSPPSEPPGGERPERRTVTFTNAAGQEMRWKVFAGQVDLFQYLEDACTKGAPFEVASFSGNDIFAKICLARLLLESGIVGIVEEGAHPLLGPGESH